MRTLVLATTNPGKVAEFRALLDGLLDLRDVALQLPSELLPAVPVIEETGQTFADNARLKARSLSQATGCVALADDSGLCVDALDGAPGLHSARWAGPGVGDAERTAALLRALVDIPPEQRTARFVCAVAVAAPDGRLDMAEGVCAGLITEAPRGAGGFGYDPVFLLPAFGRTLAELSPAEKNTVSHRALALSRLAPSLSQILALQKRN